MTDRPAADGMLRLRSENLVLVERVTKAEGELVAAEAKNAELARKLEPAEAALYGVNKANETLHEHLTNSHKRVVELEKLLGESGLTGENRRLRAKCSRQRRELRRLNVSQQQQLRAEAYASRVSASAEAVRTVEANSAAGDWAAKFRAAESELSALRAREAQDTAYPLHEVLTQLADAADHLLGEHSCDAHGYEGVGLARDSARRIAAAMQKSLVTDTDEPPAAGKSKRNPFIWSTDVLGCFIMGDHTAAAIAREIASWDSPPHRWSTGSRTCDGCGRDYDWAEQPCIPIPENDPARRRKNSPPSDRVGCTCTKITPGVVNPNCPEHGEKKAPKP